MTTAMQTPVALQASRLRVRFGGIEALGGVSVAVPSGQVVGVIGPNGAGKSTLFNAICGLAPIAEGHVVARGRRLGAVPFRIRDVLVILTLSLLATLLTSNLDALWRQVVVEPYRVQVMAARQQQPVRAELFWVRRVWRALVQTPFIHAERDGFCVVDAQGESLRCHANAEDAQHDLQMHWQNNAASHWQARSLLFLRLFAWTLLAAWGWRRYQRAVAWSPRALARAGVARTFQNIRLFDSLSTRDNLRVVAEQAQVGAVTLQELDLCLARVGLQHKADALAAELSYGERRRLEIARALALKPHVLLLDEPAAGLHAGETNELLALVRALRDEGMAILLIEHDMGLVMGVSDHVVVLDHGICIAEGSPQHVREHPDVIAAYLGDAPLAAAFNASKAASC